MATATPVNTADILARQAERGWLLPYLLALDTADITVPAEVALPGKPKGQAYHFQGHGRWTYWLDALEARRVPAAPIPQIHFTTTPHSVDARAIRDVLQYHMVHHGNRWFDDAWLLLVRWLLHGLGRRAMEPEVARIPADTRVFWYQNFNLATLLHSPIDWPAYVLQSGLPGDKPGKSMFSHAGFYSTPINVCKVMADITFGDGPQDITQSVCDPCCGTGSMLLLASNYALQLYGQDIMYDLVLCTELNGYLWMPWLVKMPNYMRDVLEAAHAQRHGFAPTAPLPTGIALTTNPEQVAQIAAERAAYRAARDAGELSQLRLFGV